MQYAYIYICIYIYTYIICACIYIIYIYIYMIIYIIYMCVQMYVCCIIQLFIHYLHLLSFSFLFLCFYCCFLFSFGMFKLNTIRSEQCSIERCPDNILSNEVSCSKFVIVGLQQQCHMAFQFLQTEKLRKTEKLIVWCISAKRNNLTKIAVNFRQASLKCVLLSVNSLECLGKIF